MIEWSMVRLRMIGRRMMTGSMREWSCFGLLSAKHGWRRGHCRAWNAQGRKRSTRRRRRCTARPAAARRRSGGVPFSCVSVLLSFPTQAASARTGARPFSAAPAFQIHFAYTAFLVVPFFCSIHWISSARARAYCEREVLSWMPRILPISTWLNPSTAYKLKMAW